MCVAPVEDDGPGFTMYSTLPAIVKRTAQNLRMYGVITYVRTDVVPQISKTRGVDWDDEGRVLIIEMQGLALINIYAVNGTDAQYVVRTTGEATGQTRHQRKREFNRLSQTGMSSTKRPGIRDLNRRRYQHFSSQNRLSTEITVVGTPRSSSKGVQ
jgi:exonuclease III